MREEKNIKNKKARIPKKKSTNKQKAKIFFCYQSKEIYFSSNQI